MPTFEYEATHDDGRTVRGVEIGSDLEQVIQSLALRGLLVSKINQAGGLDPLSEGFSAAAPRSRPVETPRTQEAPATSIPIQEEPAVSNPRGYFATNVWGPVAGTVPISNLALFFRQFATMMAAAVPIVSALDTLSKQEHSPNLARIVGEMRENARQGKPLTDAMQRYPEVFSPLQVSLMRAGETGGFMEKAARLNAEYLETELEIRNLYRRETFYPKLVIGASIVIIALANSIIQSIGRTDTRIYSPLTDPAVVFFLLPICIGVFLFFKIGLTNPRVRYNWDLIVLKVPYVGVTMQQFAMAKFGRALGALQKGGVPVATSIQLAADSCGNEYLRAQISPAAGRLQEGRNIAETLASTNAFSPLVVDMAATGEMTGSLDAMMDKIAEYYEAEARVRAQQMGRAVGVAAMVCVGIYVGIVVINFYMGYMAKVSSAGGE